jgi:hypothetical protein
MPITKNARESSRLQLLKISLPGPRSVVQLREAQSVDGVQPVVNSINPDDFLLKD